MPLDQAYVNIGSIEDAHEVIRKKVRIEADMPIVSDPISRHSDRIVKCCKP